MTTVALTQLIGRTESALKALLDGVLAETADTTERWIALNLTAASGGEVEVQQLVGRIAGARRISPSAVRATVDGLTADGLLATVGSRVRLTDTGQARFGRIKAAVDQITTQLYGDVPQEDLAVVARVLTMIVERADARGLAPVPRKRS